jgi:predicted nucleic acid-binding protein
LKLIIDTNIILKALIKGPNVRGILLSPNHEFFLPEHGIEEIEDHLHLVANKTGLSPSDIRLALGILLTNLQVVPSNDLLPFWAEAQEIMDPIDSEDTPFIATALAVRPDGIWSDDEHFKRQKKIKVWNTKNLIEEMR